MTRVKLLFLSLMLAIATWPVECCAIQRVIELDSLDSADLYGRMASYGDTSGAMDFAGILLPEQQHRFELLKGNLNDGFAHKAVWVRLTLRRSPRFPEQAFVRLNPPILNHVTAYVQIGSDPALVSSYRSIHLGTLATPSGSVLRNPDIIVPVKLWQERPVNIYLRLQSNGPIYLQGMVHTLEALHQQTAWTILFTGIVSAMIIILALWTCLYYLHTREGVFVIFSLFSLSVLVSYLSLQGIPGLFLLRAYPPVVQALLFRTGFSGELLFFLQIVLRVLKGSVKLWAKWFFFLFSGLAILNILTLFTGFHAELTQLIAWFGVVAAILILWFGRHEDFASIPDGTLYMYALQVLNIAYLTFYLRQLGFIPFEWWSNCNFPVAAIVNIFILPIFMMRRLLASKQYALELSVTSEARAVEYAGMVTRELHENKGRLEIALAAEQNANERQRLFFSMLSHEYRTPLAIIQGNVNIMEDDLLPSYSPEMSKINTAIQRLIELMEVSLDRSRLFEPLKAYRYAEHAAGDIAGGQVQFAEWLWPTRQRFRFENRSDGEVVFGDLALLNTAVFNLLENAMKYSVPGTDIEVVCQKQGGYVEYIVRNRTEGFGMENTEQLFEINTRGGNSENIAGTGIGLYLVKWIAEQHQGSASLCCDRSGMVTATLLIPSRRANSGSDEIQR